jgi:hypothetical protein
MNRLLGAGLIVFRRLWARVDWPGGLASYCDSRDIREALAAATRRTQGCSATLSVSHNNIGNRPLALGDVPVAVDEYSSGPRHYTGGGRPTRTGNAICLSAISDVTANNTYGESTGHPALYAAARSPGTRDAWMIEALKKRAAK